MNVSINPTYFCNLRCDFCYLGDKLGDRTTLPLETLNWRLREIVCAGKEIDYVDLYGGEVTLLPDEYLEEMFHVIYRWYGPKGRVNVVTNLTSVHPILLREEVDISVSFDFECRKGFQRTLQNISLLPSDKPVAILMLASPCLMSKDVKEMIEVLNGLRNVESVEIKPYSSNQYNQHPASFLMFEQFVRKFIESPLPLRPTFVNKVMLDQTIARKRNAFSDDHVYITPSGKFGVLDFDANDNEHFTELDSIQEYFKWSLAEKEQVKSNPFCRNCKYMGRCLTEHYRDVKTLKTSCNGFINLINWYERTQTSPEDLSRECDNRRP